MPESSPLSDSDIQALLCEHYGIGDVLSLTPLRGGSARCYRVDAPTGSYVLKEFPASFPYESAEREPDITHFVRERGIPATEFVRTLAGDYVVDYYGAAVHLQRFVEGVIHERNTSPPWLVEASAHLLGRLHQVLLDYPPLEPAYHLTWFEWDSGKIAKFYGDLVERAAAVESAEVRDRIVADLSFKRERLAAPDDPRVDPRRLTSRTSHGDYHTGQMICDESSVRALIDFSTACAVPAAWEIIRSYSLADPACASGRMDVGNLAACVGLYLDEMPLSPYDLEMMPHLYYAQLLRSPYGYREYLTEWGSLIAPSREPATLLEFAFWRTDLARWLDEHRWQLAEALSRVGT